MCDLCNFRKHSKNAHLCFRIIKAVCPEVFFENHCTLTVFENYTTPFYLEMQNVLQSVLIITSDPLRFVSRLVWDVIVKFYSDDGF